MIKITTIEGWRKHLQNQKKINESFSDDNKIAKEWNKLSKEERKLEYGQEGTEIDYTKDYENQTQSAKNKLSLDIKKKETNPITPEANEGKVAINEANIKLSSSKKKHAEDFKEYTPEEHSAAAKKLDKMAEEASKNDNPDKATEYNDNSIWHKDLAKTKSKN